MTVLSKLTDSTLRKYEQLGGTREALSKAFIGAAIFAYTVKLTYPILRNQLSGGKGCRGSSDSDKTSKNYNNNNNSVVKVKTKSRKNTENEDELQTKVAQAEKILSKSKRLKTKRQPGLNLDFLLQLKKLLEIMIPRPLCYETALLGIHTVCLVSRTFLSIYVAALEGAIVKFIVRKDIKNFALMLLKWFGIAIPATFINSMIRYLENKLALAFR